MGRLAVVHEQAGAGGQDGARPRGCCRPPPPPPCARSQRPLVIDGPFAETKEQLLGLLRRRRAPSLEEALDIAARAGDGQPRPGAYEIRPVWLFMPGVDRVRPRRRRSGQGVTREPTSPGSTRP